MYEKDITLLRKVLILKAIVFPVLDVKAGLQRNLSAKELMLLNSGVGKILERPLECKEIQPIQPKGDQSWVFIGRTDAEDEAPILWPSDAKSRLITEDPDSTFCRMIFRNQDLGSWWW